MSRTTGEGRGTMNDAPLMRLLRRGVFAREECCDLDCQEVMTARCAYVDRHSASCPTFWCRRHAHRAEKRTYCAAHAVSVSAPPEGGHRVATALDWVGRAIDDDIIAALRPAADRVDENLRSEPVKFGTVGLERVRMWERTWKSYSELGVGCRVSLAIEDRTPDIVQMRVNSSVVTTIVTPWEQAETENPKAFSDRFVPLLVVPAQIAVDVWLQNAMVHLNGIPRPPRH